MDHLRIDGAHAEHFLQIHDTRYYDSRMFSDDAWARVGERLDLSPRQLQLVRAVFDGLQDKEIAQTLGISYGTLRTHVRRLYAKVGVDRRSTLFMLVLAEHAVSLRAGAG